MDVFKRTINAVSPLSTGQKCVSQSKTRGRFLFSSSFVERRVLCPLSRFGDFRRVWGIFLFDTLGEYIPDLWKFRFNVL